MKTGSWYLSGVLVKISNEYPCRFYIGLPRRYVRVSLFYTRISFNHIKMILHTGGLRSLFLLCHPKKKIQNMRLYYGDAISFRAFKQKLSLRRLLHYDKDIISKM